MFPERRQLNRAIFSYNKTNLFKFGSFSKPPPKSYNKENWENQEINVLIDIVTTQT